MKTNFELLNKSLDLRRYPEHLQHSSWQAWDSADEYLIEYVEEIEGDFSGKNLLIFNDDCGTLATWFAGSDTNWRNIHWVSDSYISTQCCKVNLTKNELAEDAIHCLSSLDELKTQADIVLIKIPKTSALLQHQLIQLQKIVRKDTRIIAAGKTKTIHKSTLAFFEKYLGETKTSLAKKKSRLVFCTPSGDKQDDNPYPTVWDVEELDLRVNNHANVFSRHQYDIGGRFLCNNLPDCTGKTVVDLGCGNGIVGLAVLKRFEGSKVVFIDESYMAVESARLNAAENFPERLNDCEFLVSNCLDDYASLDIETTDIVLCNPPFHQQHGITDHIADQMFKDAFDVLEKGGELRIIGNRHLDYHHRMKKLFGAYTVEASNKKFSVLSGVKN